MESRIVAWYERQSKRTKILIDTVIYVSFCAFLLVGGIISAKMGK